MSGTLIALIVLAAILGGYIIDYQKTRLKWMSKHGEIGKESEDLKNEIKRLTRRIEHLEAIVSDESYNPIELESEDVAGFQRNTGTTHKSGKSKTTT